MVAVEGLKLNATGATYSFRDVTATFVSRGRWMCCAGFPCAFGLPSTAAAQGNQPMISELRAAIWVRSS